MMNLFCFLIGATRSEGDSERCSYAAFFFPAFNFAHLALCAAAIRFLPAAEIVRFGFGARLFAFAHRAFCARLIRLRAEADMVCSMPLERIKGEYAMLRQMDEGRKRVLLIAASILAARKLALYEPGTRVPATICAIADSIRWAEQIMEEIDRRHPMKPMQQPTTR
jgi:hypothetical protein